MDDFFTPGLVVCQLPGDLCGTPCLGGTHVMAPSDPRMQTPPHSWPLMLPSLPVLGLFSVTDISSHFQAETVLSAAPNAP